MGPGIYLILNATDAKVYVGSAASPRKRLNSHRSMLRHGQHHSPRLQRAYARDGEASFSFQVIEFCSAADLLAREQFWINYANAFGKSYNVAQVAGTRAGVPQPASVAIKLRSVHAGKPKSAEHRAKISAAQKGRVISDEQREKNRVAAIHQFSDPAARAAASERAKNYTPRSGWTMTDEQKEKLRVKAIERTSTPEARAAMVARIPKRTREEYVESARKREAAKARL